MNAPDVEMRGCLDSYSHRDGRLAGWAVVPMNALCPTVVLVDNGIIVNACPLSIPVPDDTGSRRFCFEDVDVHQFANVIEASGAVVIDCPEVTFQHPGDAEYGVCSRILRDRLVGRDASVFPPLLRVGVTVNLRKESAKGRLRRELEPWPVDDIVSLLAERGPSFDIRKIVLKNELFRDNTNSESFFALEVGAISSDETSVIGRDGHIFIYRGSNQLYEQYFSATDWAWERAGEWERLFQERRRACEKLGARFLQFVIPEKSSVVPEAFPKKLNPPTPLVQALEAIIARQGLGSEFILLQDFMAGDADRTRLYRKIDCHLNFLGCQKTFVEMARVMGFADHPAIPLSQRVSIGGDVGSRYPGVIEFLDAPDPHHVARLEAQLKLVEKINPPRGLGGHRRIFQNAGARYSKRVVAFANSFFALGEAAHELTWWFARNFSEFHFMWASEVDFKYVEAVEPDIVIAQTIERFLPIVPRS